MNKNEKNNDTVIVRTGCGINLLKPHQKYVRTFWIILSPNTKQWCFTKHKRSS